MTNNPDRDLPYAQRDPMALRDDVRPIGYEPPIQHERPVGSEPLAEHDHAPRPEPLAEHDHAPRPEPPLRHESALTSGPSDLPPAGSGFKDYMEQLGSGSTSIDDKLQDILDELVKLRKEVIRITTHLLGDES